MSKNFKGGLSSVVGTKAKEEPQEKKQGRGRPRTQTKEITKSSQEGTKENETRATFIVNEQLLEKIKDLAYWERIQIKQVINEALSNHIAKYEKKNGEIKARGGK